MRVMIGLRLMVGLSVATLVGCGSGGIKIVNLPSPVPSLTAIAIQSTSTTLVVGSRQQLSAMGSYSDGHAQDITSSVAWSSSANSVASISKPGLVLGDGIGLAKITATSGPVSGSAMLSVTDDLLAISISAPASSLNVGSSLQLTAMGTYQDGKPAQVIQNVTWTSSAPNLANVNSTGLVSGIKGGSVVVTASVGPILKTITLTVTPVLQSILVTTTNNVYAAAVGSALQCSAVANYNDGTSKDVTELATWTSNATSVAAVTATGAVKAVAAGTATIKAVYSGLSGYTVITVKGASPSATLTAIAISPNPANAILGQLFALTAHGTYSDGSVKNISASVTWQSSAPGVASVGSDGSVMPLSLGQSTISAVSESVKGAATLTVTDNLLSISISPVASSVNVGSSLQLTAMGAFQDGKPAQPLQHVTWTSSAPALASVSSTGLVTGIKGGSVAITASVGSVSKVIVLNVNAVLQSILVATTTNVYTAAIGSQLQFTAVANYNDGTARNVTNAAVWTSAQAGVASVNVSGSVTAVSAGAATIKAAYGGLSGYAVITVKGASATLTSIAISPNPANAIVGQPLALTATGTYSDGSVKNISASVTWASSAPGVATIGSNGSAMPLSVGQSTITAISGPVRGSITLVVTDNLVSISIGSSGNNVNLGGTLQLTALGTYQDGRPPQVINNAVWSSSDNTVAPVSASGLVSGVHTGSVTITATSGSVSNGILLTVVPVLQSITLSPIGPSIVVGGSQQFTATGTFNDGSLRDVTAAASWSSSNQAIATISNGDAKGVAAGAVTISATAVSANASTALNVVSNVYADLVGSYVFTLTSADTRGPSFFAGEISADGNGNISGVEDGNTGNGVCQNVPVTGTYLIYPDGRGNITLDPNSCHSSGITLRVGLYSAGKAGSLVEFDAAGNAKGNLVAQDPSALNLAAVNGNYVFRASGIDYGMNPRNPAAPVGGVGIFTASGTGNISGGAIDFNDYGNIGGSLLLPSTYSVAANGRGTFQLTASQGTQNYVFYVANAAELYFIEIDPAPAMAVAGVAELQTVQTYGPTDVKGTYAFMLDSPIVASNGDNLIADNFTELGLFLYNGTSQLEGVRNNLPVTGQYQVGNFGINGRGTFNTATCDEGSGCNDDQRMYVFYLVSPGKMFLLQTQTSPLWRSQNPAVGEADLQTGKPYDSSTLRGTYILHPSDPIASYAQKLLWLSSDGAGNLTGITDVWQNGELSSTVISGGRYATVPNYPGAGAIGLGTLIGMPDYLFYPVSPAKSWIYGLSPALDGGLDQQ